jgi:hypothetical protein
MVVGTGGTLTGNGDIIGDVLVDGGTVSPGTSPGTLSINGDFHQLPTGLLTMEIGGTTLGAQYDQLLVSGNLLLEGMVQVAFIDGFTPQAGQSFNLFSGSAASLTGPFTFVNPPPNFQYSTSISNGEFSLSVVPAGDYDADTDVDDADFLEWQRQFGSPVNAFSSADGNGDGVVNAADYVIWRNNFGVAVGAATSANLVPEPASIAIAVAILMQALFMFRQKP